MNEQTLDRDILLGAMDSTEYNRLCHLAEGNVSGDEEDSLSVLLANIEADKVNWPQETPTWGPSRDGYMSGQGNQVLLEGCYPFGWPLGTRLAGEIGDRYGTPEKETSFRCTRGNAFPVAEPPCLKGSKICGSPPQNHDDLRVNPKWPYRQREIEDCQHNCRICGPRRDSLSGSNNVVRQLRFSTSDGCGGIQSELANRIPIEVIRPVPSEGSSKRKLCSIFIEDGDIHFQFNP